MVPGFLTVGDVWPEAVGPRFIVAPTSGSSPVIRVGPEGVSVSGSGGGPDGSSRSSKPSRAFTADAEVARLFRNSRRSTANS